MALVLADRVRDTTTTTGTGTVTLSGTAPTGYQTFGAAIGNGNTTYYTINAGSQWEVGLGTYSSTGPTLARTTVLASSNGGSLVDFSTGTKDVFVTYPAEKSVNQDASGNVGIGTTSPASKLQLSGAAAGGAIQGTITNTDATGFTGFSFTDGTNVKGQFWVGNGSYGSFGGAGSINISANSGPHVWYTNYSERMRIDSSGNLLVGGTTQYGAAKLTITNAGAYMALNTTTVGYSLVRGFDNGTERWSIGQIGFGGADGMAMYTGSANTERMRIDGSGNVGIGTASPGSKLDVRGVITGGDGTIQTVISYLASAGVTGTLTNHPYVFYANNAERARIDTSGNFGIGTSSPSSRLTITGGNTEIRDGNYLLLRPSGNAWDMRLQATGTQLDVLSGGALGSPIMSLVNGGNVGIGTSSPANRLHIAGSPGTLLRLDGGAGGTGTRDIFFSEFDTAAYGGIIRYDSGADVFTFGTVENSTVINAINVPRSTGNVGIGNTNPGYRLDVSAADTTSGLGYAARLRSNATATAAALQFTNSGVTAENGLIACTDAGRITVQGSTDMAFRTNGAERARITSAGYLLVGTTTTLGGNTESEFKTTITGSWPLVLNADNRGLLVRNSSSSVGYYAYFEYNGGTNNGSISYSGGTTAYNTTSDARIKKNIVDAPDAGALIDAIKVRSWDFKVDDMHWRYGMVAQELLEVAPEAVTVPEDEEMMMGVDYAKLVPMLIKEVQSLRARVAQLEGN
jgi:hypothetical protein